MANTPLPDNRRLSTRRITDVKVFAYDGAQLMKCRLRDISLRGAFIETSSAALAKGTDAELVLKIRRGGRPTHCRLPAKVLRAEQGGVALVFRNLDAQLHKILRDIVSAQPGNQRA